MKPLQPDEVRIAIKAVPAHWVDLVQGAGKYQHVPKPPYTPGLDFAGQVMECGTSTTLCKRGDRVVCDVFSQVGPRSKSKYYDQGGFQSSVIVPESACRNIGELSYTDAVSLAGPYETSYHGLIFRGKIQAGETVLILGATGSCGSAAVELARECGAHIVIVGGTRQKLDDIVQSCPGASIVASLTYDEIDTAKQLHGQIDMVFDTVGGIASQKSLRLLRFGGRHVVIGWSSNSAVDTSHLHLPINLVLMKSLQVIGAPVVIHTQKDPSIRVERLAKLNEWIHQGRLHPAKTLFPASRGKELQVTKQAFRSKFGREVVGTAVVTFDDNDGGA